MLRGRVRGRVPGSAAYGLPMACCASNVHPLASQCGREGRGGEGGSSAESLCASTGTSVWPSRPQGETCAGPVSRAAGIRASSPDSIQTPRHGQAAAGSA